MADNWFDPPPVFDLPVTLGSDIQVSFTYQDNDGGAQPWPEGSTLRLVIDSNPPIDTEADITGSDAKLNVDYKLVDQVLERSLWRIVFTHPDGFDEVIVHGQVARFDGDK